MPGVDFEKDFPQPMVGPTDRSAGPGRRISFRGEAPVTVELLVPLRIEGEAPVDIDSLAIRRITAREMIAIVEEIGEGADDAVLIRHVTAAMAGVELDILDALSPDDAGRVAAAARPFMPAGLVAVIERASVSNDDPGEPA